MGCGEAKGVTPSLGCCVRGVSWSCLGFFMGRMWPCLRLLALAVLLVRCAVPFLVLGGAVWVRRGGQQGHLPLPVLQPVPRGEGAGDRLLPLHDVQRVHVDLAVLAPVPREGAGVQLPHLPRLPVHLRHARARAALRPLHALRLLPGLHVRAVHLPHLPQVGRGHERKPPHSCAHLSVLCFLNDACHSSLLAAQGQGEALDRLP